MPLRAAASHDDREGLRGWRSPSARTATAADALLEYWAPCLYQVDNCVIVTVTNVSVTDPPLEY